MRRIGRVSILAAASLFAVYFLNVLLGAMRIGVFMNDVKEMLTLFGACIFFVIAICILERQENDRTNNTAG